MKKEIKGFIAGALSVSLLSAGVSYAAGWLENISVVKNSATISANYNPVNADNFIYNDTTYVPLRAVTESLGCNVMWNEETRDISVINAPLFFAKYASSASLGVDLVSQVTDNIHLTYDRFERLYEDSKTHYLSESSFTEIENDIKKYQAFVEMYRSSYKKEDNTLKFFAENNLITSVRADTFPDIYDSLDTQLRNLSLALETLKSKNSYNMQNADNEYLILLNEATLQDYIKSIPETLTSLSDTIFDIRTAFFYYIQEL